MKPDIQQFAKDLIELFGPKAGEWLVTPCELLVSDRSPLQAIADGDYEGVEAIVGQMADGTYL